MRLHIAIRRSNGGTIEIFLDGKMIETQKHQQSFEALGLFQIDFGLMTLISEIFLSTEHKFGEKC